MRQEPVLGIDVSKSELVCTLVDSLTRDNLWECTVPNSVEGVARLLSKAPSDSAWVLEPTGRYSTLVAREAKEAGREVLLAQPCKARAYLRSIQSRAKTDRIDSRGLGLYALAHELSPYPLKSVIVEEIDQLLKARKGLSLAKSSLHQQMRELPAAASALQTAIAALEVQERELEKQFAQRASQNTQQHPQLAIAQELQKVPGIGLVTAHAMASCLASHSFARADQFVAYTGLDIHVVESGKRKGQRGLTKQGDPELRRLLFCCAQASLRAKNSPFAAQYERELAKGLKPTAALCAVARKLARMCWSIIHHGTSYDPDRLYQQPTRKEGKTNQSEQN